MKQKNLIFIGVIFLIAGIVGRQVWDESSIALAFIIIGVACKFIYMAIAIYKKRYRPGKELLLLYMGLAVFFAGLYMRRHGLSMGIPLEVLGVLMKLVFIGLFIRKSRRSEINS